MEPSSHARSSYDSNSLIHNLNHYEKNHYIPIAALRYEHRSTVSNPTPEIMPDLAKNAGARVIGTGRSDFPNQINNVLAFPGIFRGALDCRAKEINEEMKVAASYAIASLVDESELCEDYILPKAFDKRVGKTVAEAVIAAARKSGVARI